MQPRDLAQLNRAALELRDYLTPEEVAEFDRLLWSPPIEVKRYRHDPCAFAKEVLHMDLAPYQERVLQKLHDDRRVAFRGPRGAGKSTIGAAAVRWFLAVFPECKIPTTTSAWRQLIEFLWPEIHKWASKADWWRVGLQVRENKELFSLRIEIDRNRAAFAMSSNNESRIEGVHAPAVLFIFDESKIIPEGLWDSAEGSLGTSEEAYWLALSTPGDNAGRFYDLFSKRDRFQNWTVVVATLQECIDAGRVRQQWVDDCKISWGENSVLYKRHVLGEFAEDSGDSLIQLSWIERAQQRWDRRWKSVADLRDQGFTQEDAERTIWGDLSHIGIDPARFGDDKTGWAFRYGMAIKTVDRTSKEDTMETVGRAMPHMRNSTAIAKIDTNGLGAGVFDRMREMHDTGELREPKDERLPVISIMTQNATKNRDRSGQLTFNRLRDYLWWNVRELLEHDEIDLPPDDELVTDLVTFKWTTTSSGKVVVESKVDAKKRLGRSPDTADAVILAFAPDLPPYKPCVGFI